MPKKGKGMAIKAFPEADTDQAAAVAELEQQQGGQGGHSGSGSGAQQPSSAQGDEQHDQLYLFAQRFKLLFPDIADLPSGSSRKDILQYLRQYLGEAPLPEKGERWEVSMANLLTWGCSQEIHPADVLGCFSDDEQATVDGHKLTELDVFYTTWSTPFKLAEVRKAQEGAKAGKTQVSPLAGKQQQLAAGQGLRQSVNAGMGMAGAGQWQPQDVALVATGGSAGQAGSQTGSSGKKMAGGDKALQYRILVHLATSTTADKLGDLLAGKPVNLLPVEENELVERWVKWLGKAAVQGALEQLVRSGHAEQSPSEEAGVKKYTATKAGQRKLESCRDWLVALAKESRSSEQVDRDAALVGQQGEGYFAEDGKWYKGTITAFDGQYHLVTYEDGDQLWQNLRQDQKKDEDFRLLPRITGPEDKASQAAKKRQAAAAPKEEGLEQRREGGSSPRAAQADQKPSQPPSPRDSAEQPASPRRRSSSRLGAQPEVKQEPGQGPAKDREGRKETLPGEHGARRLSAKARPGWLNKTLTSMVKGEGRQPTSQQAAQEQLQQEQPDQLRKTRSCPSEQQQQQQDHGKAVLAAPVLGAAGLEQVARAVAAAPAKDAAAAAAEGSAAAPAGKKPRRGRGQATGPGQRRMVAPQAEAATAAPDAGEAGSAAQAPEVAPAAVAAGEPASALGGQSARKEVAREEGRQLHGGRPSSEGVAAPPKPARPDMAGGTPVTAAATLASADLQPPAEERVEAPAAEGHSDAAVPAIHADAAAEGEREQAQQQPPVKPAGRQPKARTQPAKAPRADAAAASAGLDEGWMNGPRRPRAAAEHARQRISAAATASDQEMSEPGQVPAGGGREAGRDPLQPLAKRWQRSAQAAQQAQYLQQAQPSQAQLWEDGSDLEVKEHGAALSPEEAETDDEAGPSAEAQQARLPVGGHQGAARTKRDCYWWRRTGRAAKWRLEKAEDTKICHECQGQHVPLLCKSGKGCANSYCLKCTAHYNYLFEPGHEEDLEKLCQGWCPCCIGVCGFIKCLRKSMKQQRQPVPEVPIGRDQELVAAVHLAFQLLEPAMQIHRENEAEARRQGVRLEEVPVVEIGLDERGRRMAGSERMLCNRCATTIENAHYSCGSCSQDFCVSCAAKELGPPPPRPTSVACFECGAPTQLKQLFRRERLRKLAEAERRLKQVYEDGPLSEWLQELYKPSQRQWAVEGEPITAALQLLQGQQQQQQPPEAPTALANDSTGEGGQANRGKKRRAMPEVEAAAEPAGGSRSAGLSGSEQSCAAHTNGALEKDKSAGEGSAGVGEEALANGHHANSHDAELEAAHARPEACGAGATDGVLGAKRIRRLTKKALASEAKEVAFQHEGARPPLALEPAPARAPANGTLNSMAAGAAGAAGAQSCQAVPSTFLSRHRFLPGSDMSLQKTVWWLNKSWIRPEDLRVAAQRPGGVQNVIWTPHTRVFAKDSPHRDQAIRLFTERWLLGEPIVVRGFRGRLDWSPETMNRVTRDMRTKTGERVLALNVLDCANFMPSTMKCSVFFNQYADCDGRQADRKGNDLPMFKLKDWPVDANFAEKLGRHNDDFLDMLNSVMPAYTHPSQRGTGVLNLANHLPWYARRPDLGPKGYIAYGREREHEGEGDSVTKLHEDLSQAINIMCHVQLPPGMEPPKPRCGADQLWDPVHYGHAGAVWDVFRAQDRARLQQFLVKCVRGGHPGLPPFFHQGKRLEEADVYHPIHAQCFMLTEAHREVLRKEYNVHPWHIEQYCWEGVFVPGGSPHQVRNLRSSIKVALDFVTPEAVLECLKLQHEFRELVLADTRKEEDPGSYHYADRLQVRNMVLGGLEWALDKLEEHQRRVQQAQQAQEV